MHNIWPEICKILHKIPFSKITSDSAALLTEILIFSFHSLKRGVIEYRQFLALVDVQLFH